MGKHSTKVSLNLFDFLEEMGNRLRYYVDTEYPMSSNSFGGQAIDIAWFNEEKSKFPLFIFEIESSSNNSIANNPTKVFGKESKVFEKPLFFFHIIIDSAENSEKYRDLLGLFGKHNYDIFRINNGELEQLIIKIIAQHRRIHDEFDLYGIIKLILDKNDVRKEVDIERLLVETEDLIHENQSYRIGQTYADIASIDNRFLDQYVKFIRRSFDRNTLSFLSYESYHASITAEIVNLGILYYSFGQELIEVDFMELLVNSQKTETFDKIKYLPGLNYDYDIFIHDYVPFYLALAFSLFKGHKEAQKFIFNIVIETIRNLPKTDDFIFEHHVSWGLLISAITAEYSEYFEELRQLTNENGILDTILFSPAHWNDHHKLPDSNLINIPAREDYISRFSEEFNRFKEDQNILQIAVMSLSENWKDRFDYHINLGVELANIIVKKYNN